MTEEQKRRLSEIMWMHRNIALNLENVLEGRINLEYAFHHFRECQLGAEGENDITAQTYYEIVLDALQSIIEDDFEGEK